MNSELLLAHFEHISEAPDAIPRLRSFIVDLAVRGKLVEQKLQSERVDDRYLKEPTSDHLPRNWRLLNFGKFCDIQGGNQPPKNLFVAEPRPGYVRLFQIRDLGERPVPTYIPITTANRFCGEGEILIGRYGASVGKVFWAQDGAYNVALAKFIWPESAFLPQFAFLVLKSNFFQTTLMSATRSAQAGFNKRDLAGINLPLPPIVEQHRILAKVNELMALCDRLEVARAERDSSRDRMTAACHHYLNNGGNAKDLRNHAYIFIGHLPRLTTRPNQIKQLRQTILNLAVRGQLVPQDPKDESASNLLKRIQAEKGRLLMSGAIRHLLPISPIEIDQRPSEIPACWEWVRIGDLLLGDSQNGYSQKPDDALDGTPILRISAGTVRKDGIVAEEEHKLIGGITTTQKKQYELQPGDLLACRFNGNRSFVGRLSLYLGYLGIKPIYPDKLIRLRLFPGFVLPKLVRYFAEASVIRKDIEIYCATTVGNWGISASNLKEVRIPLPPLPEQYRIVAKIDELMRLSDVLEARLTSAQTDTSRLLDAVLHHALLSPHPENHEAQQFPIVGSQEWSTS